MFGKGGYMDGHMSLGSFRSRCYGKPEASLSNTYSDKIILVADAVKGDAATVNSWVAETKANDPELVFAGEGLFSITSILDPAKMQFTYDDFEFVENLYSSVFVMSA